MLKNILFGGESGLSYGANAGLALLRIFTGIALAFGHGISKLPPSDKFVARTAEMGFPAPAFFSWAAGLSEFAGGILLAIGLLTRVSSFFIAVVMLVAVIGVHYSDPFSGKEKALLFFFIAMAFLLKGSSDWSVDSFLRKEV